jgi:hypothetical protein
MRLFLVFRMNPAAVGHVAHNGFANLVYRDMFHRNPLLASRAVLLQGVHLSSKIYGPDPRITPQM